jgi:hypothetical protein
MSRKQAIARKPARTIQQRMAALDAQKKKLEIRQQIHALRQQLKGTK